MIHRKCGVRSVLLRIDLIIGDLYRIVSKFLIIKETKKLQLEARHYCHQYNIAKRDIEFCMNLVDFLTNFTGVNSIAFCLHRII